MAMPRHAVRLTMLAVLASLAGAAIASACGASGNAKSHSGASQAAIDQLAARVQRDEMLNAVLTVSALPMHQMDESAQGGKIDNKYLPNARTLVRVVALTDWSAELKQDAAKLHDNAVRLLQALEAGHAAGEIKPLSQAAHEEWHTFVDAAWDVVAKDLPPDAGGPAPTKAPGIPPAGAATTATPMSH